MDRFTTRKGEKPELVGCIYCLEHSNCYSNMSCNEIYNALSKLRYYENLEEEGRLIVLGVEDIHPCKSCNTGWASIGSNGAEFCYDNCKKLNEYNKKYNLKT